MTGKQLKSIANIYHWLAGLALLGLAGPVSATTYVLPSKGDVIGQVQYTRAKSSENLLQIARRYDVGIEAIKVANPGVDPKSPKQGERIVIPSRHILPKGPREGIVINLAEKRLYHYTRPVMGPPLVSTYPISLGREGRLSLGKYKITQRVRKPSWTVPASARQANPRLPEIMPSGPDNPLGEYAMTLDLPDCLIHGTNKPFSIGMNVSRGCVRLYPEDIAVLAHRTLKDSSVRVVNDAFKTGYKHGALYFEIHKPRSAGNLNLAALVNKVTALVPQQLWRDDWQRVRLTAEQASGVATPVAQVFPKSKQSRRWMLQLATFKHYSSARKLMLQLEELDMPVTTRGCETGNKCRVLAGPFTDTDYMKEMSKRIKWITRIKAVTIPYQPEDDVLQKVEQTLALAD